MVERGGIVRLNMPKRSRSVLHAYVLPPKRFKVIDGDGTTQRAEGALHYAERADGGVHQGRITAGICGGARNVAAAAFGSNVMREDDASVSAAPSSCVEWQDWNQRNHFDVDNYEVEEEGAACILMECEGNEVVSPPPSYQVVQQHPNWLERAVMLARHSIKGAAAQRRKGVCGGVCIATLPDPSCVCLDAISEEEQKCSSAVATIAAAFYGMPQETSSDRFVL